MNSAVLLSIHSRHAARIYEGVKRYEFRRSQARISLGCRVYLYETKPIGLVTGMAVLDSLERVPTSNALTLEDDPLARAELDRYLAGVERVTVLGLATPMRWTNPVTLADLGLSRAPQSYRFISPPKDAPWDISPS